MAAVDLADLVSLVPLAGPSGRTFCGEAAGERVVVRLYPPGERGPAAPEIDAAVLRLVRGLIPVPEVVEVVRGDAAADRPGLLVTSWAEGTPGHESTADPYAVGRAAGGVAAALAGMPTTGPGDFVSGDLRLGERRVPDDLPAWVEHRLGRSAAWAPLLDRLLRVADSAQQRLDAVPRTCLVHGDLQLDNLLLQPQSATGDLGVSAVVDWELARSGHPATDLGRLLDGGLAPSYGVGVLDAYLDRHPADRAETLLLAGAAGLWVLVDRAAGSGADPGVTRAEARLREIARAGDVTAGAGPPQGA